MKKRRVPRDLFTKMQSANKDINQYEVIERYVLHYILEAGNKEVPVDDVFIKAGYKMLEARPPWRYSQHAA